MDMYLIIDTSRAMEGARTAAFSWLNEHIIDRFLIEGDTVIIWSAGDRAELIYSATISGAEEKRAIRNLLQGMEMRGQTPDFSGAMRDVTTRISRAPQGRISYTVLITATAAGLGPAFRGGSRDLFRWFRTERFEQWQALVIAPHIGPRVHNAAAAFMTARN